jgi:hemoglobin-like flavoprotein
MWTFAANLQTEEEMKESYQLRSHGNKIFEAINGAVNSLDNLDVMNVRLNKLGLRHQSYGAQAEHYWVTK